MGNTFNFANLLTFIRIVCIPLIAVVFFMSFELSRPIAAVIFILAALTDWLDGWVAREFDQTSKLGAFLDPVADKLIVVARTSGETGDREGITLFLVDREAEGVNVVRTLMADSRNAANIEITGVSVSSDAVVGEVGKGADILDPALDIARIGISAEMLGSLEECFERTVEYLKERKQFGVAIGSFQALKHRAANMFCEIELSKS